jgi:hypothetical protein
LIRRSYEDHSAKLRPTKLSDVGFENVESALPRSRVVEAFSNKYSFLRKSNVQSYDFEVGPGRFEIGDIIKLPYGYSLLIQPNTSLIFSQKAGLIVRGKLDILGSATEPVVLKPIDDYWSGIAVIESSELSTWQHVKIMNTQGLNLTSDQFDGGVSFILSDFNCTYCVFSGNKAADTVNIVGANFSLANSQFVNAAADFLDTDFSHGVLRDVSFSNSSEGDAIDVGGGVVTASGVQIVSVGDKGISAGERAVVKMSDSSIKDVAFGAASKDGANIELSNVDIDRVTIGLLAYRQSASLGYGVLSALGVNIASSLIDTAQQQDSTLIFNEAQSAAVPINVSLFYFFSKLEPTYFKAFAMLVGLAAACFYFLARILYRWGF